MVYESDFYTTRRPYRTTPSYSSYTTSFEPSRQVRILPGLGKVHIVHSYDRLVPYVGHKRLTVVSGSVPKVYSTRPSVLHREYDWIEKRLRPSIGYSATNRYLNSDSAVRIIYLPNPVNGVSYRMYPTAPYLRHKIYKPQSLYCDYYEPIRSLYWNSSYWPLYRSVGSFVNDLPSENGLRLQKIFDDETRLIRAETSSLLRRIHDPVPRVRLNWPAATTIRYISDSLPARYSNDNYIHKMLTTSPMNRKVQFTTYYTEPVRKYIGTGGLSCVSYAGERSYNRRPYIYLYENPLQSDIQLLSYYINKFKQEKAGSGVDSTKSQLSPARPTRKFGAKSAAKEDAEAAEEMQKLREARAARLAFINEEERETRVKPSSYDLDDALRAKKEKEEARLAEEKAYAEEQSRQEALAKEAARKAELARQEELAAKAAAERAAELEKQAELARQEEKKRQEEIARIKREEEERQREEEQRLLEENAKAEEERKQLERLEELARQAEEEREAELARQAEELAELARQEAELAEQEKLLAEEEERKRQEAEKEELARQEAELAELERQEKELEEQAREAREDAEAARIAAEEAELEAKQAELEEIEGQTELENNKSELEHAEETEAHEEEQIEQEDEEEAERARLEELAKAEAELKALEEEAQAIEPNGPSEEVIKEELSKRSEEEEWARARAELEELEKAQAELDALEAEARAMEAEQNGDYEDDNAIAEDVPGEQSDLEEQDE